MVTAHFLPVLRFNSKLPPLGKPGVERQQEREKGKGGRKGRLGGGPGAAGPGGECLPFLRLCPHSRDLPPTRKGKLKASSSDHESAAQGRGIRGRAPGGGWGSTGPRGSVLHRGQESCRFLFPVLGSLGASLLARGGHRQCCSYVGGRHAGPGARRSQPGQPGRPGTRRGQRICCGDGARPLCHSPTFLAGGGLRGGGKQLGSLSTWL